MIYCSINITWWIVSFLSLRSSISESFVNVFNSLFFFVEHCWYIIRKRTRCYQLMSIDFYKNVFKSFILTLFPQIIFECWCFLKIISFKITIVFIRTWICCFIKSFKSRFLIERILLFRLRVIWWIVKDFGTIC